MTEILLAAGFFALAVYIISQSARSFGRAGVTALGVLVICAFTLVTYLKGWLG